MDGATPWIDFISTIDQDTTKRTTFLAGLQATGAVTQITSLATGVTLNAQSGVITTVSATTAAASTTSFVVTNSAVKSTSAIMLKVDNYAGTYFTNGMPIAQVSGIAAGSFTIVVINTHATNALAGILKIGFAVN